MLVDQIMIMMLIGMRFMLHRFNIYTLCYMVMKICKLGFQI